MCPVPYYILMRQSKDPKYLRLQIVLFAQQHGIKPAAQKFSSTPKTVRKWLRRWQTEGYAGLEELSRAPHHPVRRISPAQRRRAIQLKRQLPSWGAARLKRDYQLSLSDKALRRIWRQEGLLRRKRRKHQVKHDLRAVKAAWRLFEPVDIDTKDLDDIPQMWPQIRRLGLPLIQYTAREVVSGLHFLAYAQERSLACATLFAQLLIDHFHHCGVVLQDCHFQTDNGSEFIGSVQARHDSTFTKTVQAVPGLLHTTIPPAAHTWQADVETAHRLIEDEFYEVESFSSRSHFLTKAATYNLWFNTLRKNSYKQNRSPWEILHTRNPALPIHILTFPPVFLDHLLNKLLDLPSQRGYDLIPYP
jgi:transposase